jgi:hypothetical protein
MMTSTPVTQQQQTDGRTVGEVVEFNQELVNEVWCRRIFRQILQSLELQYAMQMPHRPISPDTVLVLDSGDPMLLPSPDVGTAWSEAGDMHDLAAVVHYAITREFPPAAPLQGRVPDEYSETFITAVDRCLSPDPQQRPHTIEQLRNLLGIVPLGPAIPTAAPAQGAAPASAQAASAWGPTVQPEPAVSFLKGPPHVTEQGRLQRWLMMVAAATILLVALGALFALLHQADSRDTVTLALPGDVPDAPQTPAQAQVQAQAPTLAPALPDPVTPEPAAGTPDPSAVAAAPADAQPVTTPGALPATIGPAARPPAAPPPATAAATTPPPRAAGQAPAYRPVPAASGATFKLVIKPWGMVQVDGVDQGASPPLKRLTLSPGQHTIRIVNPNFPEHTVTVNALKGASSVIEMDFTEEEAQ